MTDTTPTPTPTHVPVLVGPVLEFLSRPSIKVLVDCTVGLGGHARRLLEAQPDLRLVGLDADSDNLELARKNLADFGSRVQLIHSDFSELRPVLTGLGVATVDAVLADLGLSSNQIADPMRGFSFEYDGPLDMRIDRGRSRTAADLVNSLSGKELSDLLWMQCQERQSRKISRRICQARREGRLRSTGDLARLVALAVGSDPAAHRGRIHPATRTFLALRMAVNRETDALEELLAGMTEVLSPGGRVAVISFHSTEDRIVKNDFRSRARDGVYQVLTPKPIVADAEERGDNRRSRSAKLRVAEKRISPL